MKHLFIIERILCWLLACCPVRPWPRIRAGHRSARGFSFHIGEVGMAYDDGYYDRSHRWHDWRHAREREWYRVNYRNQYRGYRHDRDHDGIPDRMDRDRDNDGVPNYRDSRPNNPYRR